MELIISDALYDTPEWEEGKYSEQLASQLVQFDPDVSVKDTDIGKGADWPVVVVEIFNKIDWSSLLGVAGVGGLFLMGEKINKNIDAWLEIGKKLGSLIDKFKPARVDEYAALVIIFNDFIQNYGQQNKLDVSIQIIEFNAVQYALGNLAKRPDALYIVSVKTSDKTIIYGIKSNRKIEFKHELSTQWIDF